MATARDALVNTEMEKVKEARKLAEAHRVEEIQAANAAIAGRIAGTNEALGDSVEAADAMMEQWKKEAAADRRDEMKEALKQQEQANHKAEAELSSARKKEEKGLERQIRMEAKAEEDAAQADVAEAGTLIDGPQHVKDHVLKFAAHRAAERYAKDSAKSESFIDEAASGEWPGGAWPVGP